MICVIVAFLSIDKKNLSYFSPFYTFIYFQKNACYFQKRFL
jgi:hypothetical protein